MEGNKGKIDDDRHPTDKNRDKELGQKEENANTLLMHCLESFIWASAGSLKAGLGFSRELCKAKKPKQNHILYMNINI